MHFTICVCVCVYIYIFFIKWLRYKGSSKTFVPYFVISLWWEIWILEDLALYRQVLQDICFDF